MIKPHNISPHRITVCITKVVDSGHEKGKRGQKSGLNPRPLQPQPKRMVRLLRIPLGGFTLIITCDEPRAPPRSPSRTHASRVTLSLRSLWPWPRRCGAPFRTSSRSRCGVSRVWPLSIERARLARVVVCVCCVLRDCYRILCDPRRTH